jgi:hypothetical protein
MKNLNRNRTEQKYNPFFSLLILLAMVCTACHQESIKEEDFTPNNQIPATLRSCIQDCDDCSTIAGECCCAIAVVSDEDAHLEICSPGLANCSGTICVGEPDPPCSKFFGASDTTTLNLTGQRGYFFCQPNGEPLRIINTGTSTITLKLYCNIDIPPPPFVQFSLNPQDTIYLFADGNCEPDFCN